MTTEKKIAASVIANQLALHFNEELKHTGIYKRSLKYRLNGIIKELQEAEKKEFDLVFNENEEAAHAISANLMDIVNTMVKDGFTSMLMVGNMQLAYKKNPKAVEGIINKILNK